MNLKNLFRFPATKPAISTKEQSLDRKKTQDELIDEIHETFFTEVDKILAWAKIQKALPTDKDEIIEKGNRLHKLGFTASSEKVEMDKAHIEIATINRENEKRKILVKAIDYFSFTYPQYKFITIESIEKICEKYALVYGEVSKYKGTVPDFAVDQMEKFNVKYSDRAFQLVHRRSQYSFNSTTRLIYGSEELLSKLRKDHNDTHSFMGDYYGPIEQCPLQIAAPISLFDTRGMEVKNYQLTPIVDKDPIVFMPVFFMNMIFYLIVTAWGKEANDELVVNPNRN